MTLGSLIFILGRYYNEEICGGIFFESKVSKLTIFRKSILCWKKSYGKNWQLTYINVNLN